MGYGEQSLGQNEKLIYEAHFHGSYYSAAWFALIFLIVLAVGALVFATGTQQWVLLGISAAGLAFVLYQMIPIWTTEIAVTNHRLVIKRGWLTRSTTELQLKSIEQVNFHQGLLGRLLDFGRIEIHGTGMDDLRLPNIGCPTDLIKAIEERIHSFETAAAAACGQACCMTAVARQRWAKGSAANASVAICRLTAPAEIRAAQAAKATTTTIKMAPSTAMPS